MGKKKSKGEPAPGVSSSAEQLNIELSAQLPALEAALGVRRSSLETALRRQASLAETVHQKREEARQDEQRTLAIAADLARQYKAPQEELIAEINSLESRLTEYREEAEMARHELSLMARDKDDEIAIKEQVVFDLRMKINEMTNEFAAMLGNAVTLMKQKLADVAHAAAAAGTHAATAATGNAVVSLDDALSGKARVAYLQRLQDFATDMHTR